MKAITLLFSILFFTNVIAQDAIVFEKVNEVGTAFAKHLKEGNIAPLKKKHPVSKTWTYEKLEEYKAYLTTEKLIVYGSFINPTGKKELYDFNFYALRKEGEKFKYFYTMSIIVSAKDEKYKVLNFMIFTEESSLKAWWQSTFRFFESDAFKTIPKSVIHPDICPPPPNFKA